MSLTDSNVSKEQIIFDSHCLFIHDFDKSARMKTTQITTKNIFAIVAFAAILALVMPSSALAEEQEFGELNEGEGTPKPPVIEMPNGGMDPDMPNGVMIDNQNNDNGLYAPNPAEANGVWKYEIQSPFEATGISCNVVEVDTVMMCVFYGADIEKIELLEDFEDNISLGLPEPEPEEIFVDLNGVMSNEPEPEPKSEKQSAIEYLESLKEEGKIMPSEREVLRLLLDAQKRCEFGVEEGEAIQTYAYFDVPKSAVDITRSFNYDRNHLLSSIAKLIESCDTWSTYKGIHLGPEYTNKILADKDAVEKEFKRLGDLHALSWNYDVLSEHDFIEATEDATSAFCESSLYGNHTKANYGCLNIGEAPNRGGYSDVSQNPIMLQYLESKETGINIVNPDETPENYVSPKDSARNYLNVYGHIPAQVLSMITADELADLLAEYEEKQQQKGETQ